MKDQTIPTICPSCGGALIVVKMQCLECGTEISGAYRLCPVCRLEGDTRKVFNLFMKARGNLKQVQRELGVSYPTARQKMQAMFRKLGQDYFVDDPKQILKKVRSGELSVDEAEILLRGGNIE